MRMTCMAAGLVVALLGSAAWADDAEAPSLDEVNVDTYGVSLVFDQPMLTWDTVADSTVVRIEPAIDCRWVWEDDTTLACIGNATRQQVHQATPYRVSVGTGLWTQEGVAFAPTTQVVETDRPEVEASLDWDGAEPRVWVGSDQALVPGSLEPALQVTIDAKPVPFHLVAEDRRQDDYSGWKSTYRLELGADAPRTGVLAVAITPGVRSKEGPLPGVERKTLLSAVRGEPFAQRPANCRRAAGAPQRGRRGTEPMALGGCQAESPVEQDL
jgi:hypothetical protein